MAKKDFVIGLDVLNAITPSSNALTLDIDELKGSEIVLQDILAPEGEEIGLKDADNENNQRATLLFKTSKKRMIRVGIRAFINQMVKEGNAEPTRMYQYLSEKATKGNVKLLEKLTIEDAEVRKALDGTEMFPASAYKVFQEALAKGLEEDPAFSWGTLYNNQALMAKCTGDDPALLSDNARPYKALTFSI